MGKTAWIRIQNKSSYNVTVAFDERDNVHERGLDKLQGTLAPGAQFPVNNQKDVAAVYEVIEGEPTLRIHRNGRINVVVNKQGADQGPDVVRLACDRSHWWVDHNAGSEGAKGKDAIFLSTDIDDEDEDNEAEDTHISVRIFNAVPTATWMASLATTLAPKPFCNVAMPGTHDSGTYTWNKELGASPDSDLCMTIQNALEGKGGKGLLGLGVGSMIADHVLATVYDRMCKCQDLSIADQLNAGIRYLDLRVAWNEQVSGFYTCHGVYCVELKVILDQIVAFLKQNNKEIVLLDFNHFYKLQPENHKALAALITDRLGDMMAIQGELDPNSTMKEYWDKGVQAVTVYHDDETQRASNGKLWSRGVLQSPWPNKNQTKDLHESLQGHIRGRNKNKFFVLQGILTPDGELIKQEIMESQGKTSIKSIARRVSGKVVDWVDDEWKGETHNIVIVDFFQDCSVVPAIIHLNQ